MKHTLLVATLLLVALSSCAAGSNPLEERANEDGEVAGFWQGLWHGIIAPFAFVFSLFSDSIGLYQVRNNGNWYDLGYLLGLMTILGGSGRGSAGRRRSDR